MGLLRLSVLVLLLAALIHADYNSRREALIAKEYSYSLFADIELTDEEQAANTEFMIWSDAEMYSGIARPQFYPAFYPPERMKAAIASSPVFQIIKVMPKGGLLHSHCLGMVSTDYVFNLTYRENLWVCDQTNQPFQLKYFHGGVGDTCEWKLVKDIREKDPFYDIYLRSKLNYVKPYVNTLSEADRVAVKELIQSLVFYQPNFEDFIYNGIKEVYDDGIRYAELRYALHIPLYDCYGKTFDYNYIIKVIKKALARFQKDNPDFIGLKIIYLAPRDSTDEQFRAHLNTFKKIKAKYSDIVIGFDFDGPEDNSRPLKDFAPELIRWRSSNDIDLYLHAGVTGWYGIYSDENLIDAILLDSKRIAHGWALAKHPLILKEVKDRDICIEVSPLSDYYDYNLFTDIRNHPAAEFGAYHVPYVLSNGNPAYYGGKGVNYDWYLAFMGYASGRDNLRFFKKLILNSIQYAAIDDDGKAKLQEVFQRDWDEFIRKLANKELVQISQISYPDVY